MKIIILENLEDFKDDYLDYNEDHYYLVNTYKDFKKYAHKEKHLMNIEAITLNYKDLLDDLEYNNIFISDYFKNTKESKLGKENNYFILPLIFTNNIIEQLGYKTNFLRTYKKDRVFYMRKYITSIEFENIIKDEKHLYHWLLDCSFKDANIEMDMNNKIFKMSDATWLDGTWKQLNVYDSYSLFTDGVWKHGIFEYGEFNNSTWYGGEFNDGSFNDSNWYNGVFNGGKFEKSNWYNGTFEDGFFVNSTWKRGVANGGEFRRMEWEDGVFNGDEFRESKFKNGDFNGGKFIDSELLGGHWNNGLWDLLYFSKNINLSSHKLNNNNMLFSYKDDVYTLKDVLNNKDNIISRLKRIIKKRDFIFLGDYKLTIEEINNILDDK